MKMLLYIDPGTGSMLFTILIGLVGAGIYAFRLLVMKLKFFFGGGKKVYAEQRYPFVIFSDDKRYWSVFEPVCSEFEKRGIDVVYMTSSDVDPALTSGYSHIKAEFIGEGNKSFAKLNFLKADILLSTTPGLDVYQWKRSRDVSCYVHLLHAASEVNMYRSFGIDYYDTILISGDFQREDIRALERLRNLPEKELVKTGIPYMDEMKKRLDVSDEPEKGGITVLLAPTWGAEGILSKYGDEFLNNLTETGYHIIIRPHPQSFVSEEKMIHSLMDKYPESEQIEWNRDLDNFDVLRKADIMISDFSGVIFDFSLVHDKPVIYTDAKIDTSLYDAWWLDSELWTETALPRLGMEINDKNIMDIKSIIADCIENDRFAAGRNQVRSECWAYPGEGSKRVVDYLVNKREKLIGVNES